MAAVVDVGSELVELDAALEPATADGTSVVSGVGVAEAGMRVESWAAQPMSATISALAATMRRPAKQDDSRQRGPAW